MQNIKDIQLHKKAIVGMLNAQKMLLFKKLDILPNANLQDMYWALGQQVIRRNALVKSLSALKNQLHIQLSYSYPSYKKFFSETDSKTALAFFVF